MSKGAGARKRRSSPPESTLIAAARREAAELAQSAGTPPMPPDAIPGIRIVREIGRGGMGVIYEAQPEDLPRPVALKVMRGGQSVSEHRLLLFRQEVETLARLNHPDIAAIYGAGSTEDGRQYFTMELVRGVPLTDYARARELPLHEQLQLFRRVCEAVHYAHQRGVIHRDLKPSNIIVDDEGNPKVVDFGLARLTDADESMRLLFTEAGKMMGTLPYMSPEQAEGRHEDVDVRSDVYALGVILYELLTDRLPYDVTGAGREEARKVICEQLPRRPSTISRSLRGDLERIVLKALEKDPARRYQSAAALAEDLDRLLTNRPVSAHPPSMPYLARKWVARHKTLTAYLATLLLVGVGLAWWQADQRAQARQRELDALQRQRAVDKMLLEQRTARQRELAAAREVEDFWKRLFAWALTQPSPAGQGFESLLAEAAQRVDEELGDRPAAAAAVHYTLAQAYVEAGRPGSARRHLEQAITLWDSLPRRDHPDLDHARELLARLSADQPATTAPVP